MKIIKVIIDLAIGGGLVYGILSLYCEYRYWKVDSEKSRRDAKFWERQCNEKIHEFAVAHNDCLEWRYLYKKYGMPISGPFDSRMIDNLMDENHQ
jgi:hypothetical protein